MNTQDYNEISRIIRDSTIMDYKDGDTKLDQELLVNKLVKYFSAVNPRFQSSKFIEFCKVEW